jgi:hypothetical protein
VEHTEPALRTGVGQGVKLKNKRGVEQRYGKPQKKQSSKNPGNEKSLYSNKTHSRRPLQQTRTSGRQNLRIQR